MLKKAAKKLLGQTGNPFAARRATSPLLFLCLFATTILGAVGDMIFHTRLIWFALVVSSITLSQLRDKRLIRCPRCGKALTLYRGLNWDILKKNRDTCHECGFTEKEFLAAQETNVGLK